MKLYLNLLSLFFLCACMQTPPLPEDHIYNKQGDNSPYATTPNKVPMRKIINAKTGKTIDNQTKPIKPSGYVILQFDVGEDGSTENIQVIDAKPKDKFDNMAIEAVAQWNYKKGEARKNEKIQLDFVDSGK